MKVDKQMIDKQIRFRGYMADLLSKPSSEEKYVKSMQNLKKVTDKLKGLKVRGLETTEEWITRADGSKLRVCIYKPRDLKKNVPGVLWLHGGGYALGIPEFFAGTYKRLIEARDCIVIAPDYRLSIEAPYPAALEDSYTTLMWMKNHAEELGINSNQLIVGGESAGGGLTAAVTLCARDRGEVNVAFQMPLYPMLDDRMETASAKENDAPIWNSNKNRWAWNLYLRELDGDNVPTYAAPGRESNYNNLPPAVTFVGDIEPFRDETIEYVKNLRESGIQVDFEIFKGCYHGFDIIQPKAEKSIKAIDFFVDAFKHAVDHYYNEQP